MTKFLLFSNKWPAQDGWSKVAFQLHQILLCQNYSVSLSINGYEDWKADSPFSTTYSLSYWWLGVFKYFFYLLRHFSRFRFFDKFIIIPDNHIFLSSLISWFSLKPTYQVIHGTYGVYFMNHFGFLCSKKITYIFVSKYTLSRVHPNVVKKFVVHVAHNAVDANLFANSNNNLRDKVIFVGNQKKRKGLLDLLDAITLLYKRQIIVKLIIVGRVDQLLIKSKYPFIFDNIEFYCNIDDSRLVELYNESLVNILISKNEGHYFEGFGLVHIEAISCGCFSIGSINSGNSDIVDSSMINLTDISVSNIADTIANILESQCIPKEIDDYWKLERMSCNYLEIFG
jgi:glycosyltransferase involved in cell wall biosynthesis